MPKHLYDSARDLTYTTGLGWTSGTWRVSLVSSGYVYAATHDFHNDLTNIIATAEITTRAITNGAMDAADATFSAVAGGSTAVAAVIWRDTGVSSTSPLFLYDSTLRGLPYVTNGGDIVLHWGDGSYRIWKLPETV